MFDAEEYGSESIKKFSKIISQNINAWAEDEKRFTFELQTTQLND